jgi:threonine dehydrogenase-like Zn-dependent dehydrogenase
MRAVVCTGPGELVIEEVPRREPERDEVRVRVRACGLCGSDLHLLPVGYLGPRVTPGHEMMGEVDAVGAGVKGFETGQPVAVEPLSSCGSCPTCQRGLHAICPQTQIYGIHRGGGFAEYVNVPACRLYPVAEDLPPAVAALAEPMAVVVHGLHRARLEPGQRVLVLGAGSVGLLAVLAARALGAADVWLTARHEHQARLGVDLGATRVLREAEATPERLAELGRDALVDCVLETVGGQAETLPQAIQALKPGGIVSVLGLFSGPLTLDPFPLLVKELTLAWSNCYEHPHGDTDFAAAIRLLSEHREILSRIPTHQVGLDEIQRAFALARDKSEGVVKVTVNP